MPVLDVVSAEYHAAQQLAANTTLINQIKSTIVKTGSKLVNVADLGYSSRITSLTTNVVGTSEMMFKIGTNVTQISPMWENWYTSGAPNVDTDPSSSVSFNASFRIVSSSNPNANLNTLYRLTFDGRTTATLDPGAEIIADPVAITLFQGDVIAVRTFLISGTAHCDRTIFGLFSTTVGGFVATTDLTAPGSAAIPNSQAAYYGPSAILGYAQDAASAKSVFLMGDSIAAGVGDTGSLYTAISICPGGFGVRALTGKAGLINAASGGDMATYFQGTSGSFRRYIDALKCNTAIIEYGVNDLYNLSISATQLETVLLYHAKNLRRLGISKVFLTTITPYSNSTDGWVTLANQTINKATQNIQRLAHNTWVRAGCPIDPNTLLPVAVGTNSAILAGSFGHPITDTFDVASKVESSFNSGLWLPAQKTVIGSMAASSSVINLSSGTFNSANQELGGDKGSLVFVPGAGASGGNLIGGFVGVINSTTQATLNVLSGTAVTNVIIGVNVMTVDGLHPSSTGHNLVASVIDVSKL